MYVQKLISFGSFKSQFIMTRFNPNRLHYNVIKKCSFFSSSVILHPYKKNTQ